MPIVQGNPQFPNQYGFNGSQPYTTQLNFGEMKGEVLMWNPDIDPLLVGRIINNKPTQTAPSCITLLPVIQF